MAENKEVLEPTAADDIAIPEDVVELPDAKTRAGKPVVVKVRLVGTETITPILGGIPDRVAFPDNRQKTAAEVAQEVLDFHEPCVKLATVGVVAPQFYFGATPEPGKAPWDALTVNDKAAIFYAILRVSGYSSARTDALRTFPADEGSGAVRDASANGRENGAPAESKDAEWPTTVGSGG